MIEVLVQDTHRSGGSCFAVRQRQISFQGEGLPLKQTARTEALSSIPTQVYFMHLHKGQGEFARGTNLLRIKGKRIGAPNLQRSRIAECSSKVEPASYAEWKAAARFLP